MPKAISGYDIHVALCHNQLDLAVLTEEPPRLTPRVGGVDDIDAAGGRLVPDAQQVVLEDALRVHVVVAVVADGRQQHGQQRRRAPLTAACRVRHPTGAGGRRQGVVRDGVVLVSRRRGWSRRYVVALAHLCHDYN